MSVYSSQIEENTQFRTELHRKIQELEKYVSFPMVAAHDKMEANFFHLLIGYRLHYFPFFLPVLLRLLT